MCFVVGEMSDSPAVELRKVSKVFPGGVKAVDDVTLQIPVGGIVALLGPSGGGKTTTLRLINRLEEATAGEVLVRGRDVRGQRPESLRRSIGYVVQEGGLFPHLNVSANVATVPRLLGWPRARVRRRVGGSAGNDGPARGPVRTADAGGAVGRPAAAGRRRPGAGRRPRPPPDGRAFRALDPGTRETIQDEFLRLHARLRKTVVLVTHDIAEAGRLAEQIVLIDGGRVVQRGTLRDLLLRPADERVRAFLGRRRQELALEVLRVRHVLPDLPRRLWPTTPLRLSADLPFGRALASPWRTGATPRWSWTACRPTRSPPRALQARILDDLKAAGSRRVSPARNEHDARGQADVCRRLFDELGNAWTRSQDTFWPQTLVFLSLTLRALGLALLAGLPLGVLLTRLRRVAGPVIAVLALVQTVPSLVLLGLLIPLLGIGQAPALFAAVVYSLFPVVLNTYVGITQVSPAVRDAARGMGMTPGQILWNVEAAAGVPRHSGRRPHRRRLRQRR